MMREAEAAEEGMGSYKSFVMPTSEDDISGVGAAAGAAKPWDNSGTDVDDDITDIWSRPSAPSQSSGALPQPQFAASTATAAAAATASATGAADISAALSMSKFQQQLSGQWNERVLRKEQYSSGVDTTTSASPFSPVPSPAASTAGSVGSAGSAFPYDSNSAFAGASTTNNRYGSMTGGVDPSMLPPPFSDLAGDDGLYDGGKFIPLPTSIPVDPDAELAEVLAEIDKDYNALRSKLVRLIEARGRGVATKPEDPVQVIPEEL